MTRQLQTKDNLTQISALVNLIWDNTTAWRPELPGTLPRGHHFVDLSVISVRVNGGRPNIGLRIAKAMKRMSIFHFVLLILATFLWGNPFVTKGIAFEKKTECRPKEERTEELETWRPALYGSIFIGDKGTAHVFLNYMGIVVSSSGKQLEFDFKKRATQYISEVGGASFLITPRFLEEYSFSNLQVLETINLLETKIFWSYQNCLMVEPRGEKTKQHAQEHNIQVWAIPSIISDSLLFQPPVGISQVNPLGIWPDSGDLDKKMFEIEEEVKEWMRKQGPWQPGDPIEFPWDPPQTFMEDIEKVEKFSGLAERRNKSIFYIFLGKIKSDGSLSRQCVGVVTREPSGNVGTQWLPTVDNVRTIIQKQTEYIYIPELSPQT